MIRETETAVEVLKVLNCKDIKTYSLINNYGCTFYLEGRKYDIRYWANYYGEALNKWIVSPFCVDEKRSLDELDNFIKSSLDYMFNYSNIKE